MRFFKSTQWEAFPPWNHPHAAMNPIGFCSPGYSQADSSEANSFYSIASATIYLIYLDWKLLTKPAICVEGVPTSNTTNVLGWRLALTVCTAAFIVLIFFSASTAAFLTKRSLWFHWWLVSVGRLGGTWTPSDINNYLTLVMKLLKKVAAMSNVNTTSCGRGNSSIFWHF